MTRKVIFLITDLDLGGCPLLLLRIVRDLKARGRIAPLVVSIKSPGPVARWIRLAGVEVVGLHAAGPTDYRAAARWVRLLDDQKPDAVFSMLVHANLLATLASPFASPCVYIQSLHTLQPEPQWHWRAGGILGGLSSGVVAPSRAIFHRLAKEGFTGPEWVIPNGIDVEVFQNAEQVPVADRPWPANALVAGYIGRFDPVKRLDVLLRGFATLLLSDYDRWRRLYLAMIGYGPMESRLRALAVELGIVSHVAFPGPTARPQEWYKCFDVFINPSIVEGFGLSAVEAMAAGVPVVACRGGAVSEIITHGASGWLVDGGVARNEFSQADANYSTAAGDALAEGIATVLGDSALKQRLVEGGKNRVVGEYTTLRMIDRYEQLLTTIL